jgi:hypothetical protein
VDSEGGRRISHVNFHLDRVRELDRDLNLSVESRSLSIKRRILLIEKGILEEMEQNTSQSDYAMWDNKIEGAEDKKCL